MKQIFKDPIQFLKDLSGWKLNLAAFLTGLLFYLGQPPFNHESSPILALFPFISFISLIPLFEFSVRRSFKESMIAVYIFGLAASATQIYWLSNVQIEGLWILILLGMCVGIMYMALNFLIYGFVFRVLFNAAPKSYLILYPLFWVIYEYLRTFTEISFPWGLSGYALMPVLPLAQFASVTGVYGLSFILVLGNTILFNTLFFKRNKDTSLTKKILLPGFIAFLLLIAFWGNVRIKSNRNSVATKKISLIQSNIDQANWSGRKSLIKSLEKTDLLIKEAEKESSDLVIFPESGIYTYLQRDRFATRFVRNWQKLLNTPLLLGTLHTEKLQNNPYYKHHVFNSVFHLSEERSPFEMYHKMKLVPFSEALPFEGMFPILSRINLGESDFRTGKDETIFDINGGIKAAPYICYEIIYPNFVRRRAASGANLLVTVTNDGWFGKSTAPYLHAAMARMRAVETGLPLVRCANTGVTFAIDPVGQIVNKGDLYTSEVITADVPFYSLNTIYRRFGDWFPLASVGVFISILIYLFYRKR